MNSITKCLYLKYYTVSINTFIDSRLLNSKHGIFVRSVQCSLGKFVREVLLPIFNEIVVLHFVHSEVGIARGRDWNREKGSANTV